jgi:mRNA interferase RelE/StbE
MKTIIFTAAADKQLEALPATAREQVLDGLIGYATTGRGDIKTLTGRESIRLRVGRYRIVLDEDRYTVIAIHIGKRETTTYRKH